MSPNKEACERSIEEKNQRNQDAYIEILSRNTVEELDDAYNHGHISLEDHLLARYLRERRTYGSYINTITERVIVREN